MTVMDDDPDLILMRGVAAGTPGAFETLRRRYGRYVRKIVASRISDHADADDVTQFVLIRLWQTAHRFNPRRASLSTWVGLITSRAVCDGVRRRSTKMRKAERPLIDDCAIDRPDLRADEADEAAFMACRAVCQIAEMPPRMAHALELVFCRGMSFRQSWTAMDVREGTLKSTVSRGLARLRRMPGAPSRPQRMPRPRQATPPPAPTSP